MAIAALLACVAVSSSAATKPDAKPVYRINFHVIGAGASVMRSSCYRLLATTGQTAPGYSYSPGFSLVSGFWASAIALATDPPSVPNNTVGCTS
jgi:hypothetical protein